MTAIENVLWLLVLIGVMINLHELGHFWAARFFDVKVEAFSFGFGKRLFGIRRGETDYRFSLIPLGGYVKMAGEQASDEHLDDPRSFMAKPRWQRLIIAAAGPFMNVVLAIAVLTGLFMVKYQKVADSDLEAVVGHVMPDSAAAKAGVQDGDRIVDLDGKPHPTWDDVGMREVTSANRPMQLVVERGGKRIPITVTPIFNERLGVGFAGWDERGQIQLMEVEPNYPAEKAGLKPGDLLVAVNGQPIHSAIKFQEITKGSSGKPLDVEFERTGDRRHVTVQPVFSELDGPARWMIGVKPQQKFTIVTTKLSFQAALRESLNQNKKYAMLIVQVLKGIVERRVSPKNLSGPIGIAQQAGDAARHGAADFFMLMSLVSLNLAIFNLLPIPILDGGVILMLLVEMVMQRDLSLNVKEAVFKVGFVCIMVIVAFVLYNDIAKILPGGG
jgi:regulator of sigma E protease